METTNYKELSRLPKADSESIQKYYSTQKRSHYFLQHSVRLGISSNNSSLAIFAEVTPEGQVAELYGSANALAQAEAHGICANTNWRMEKIGYNAIAAGIQSRQQTVSIGTEHPCSFLQPFAIYFVPLLFASLHENSVNSRPELIGGIAVLVPAKQQNNDYFSLLNTLASVVLFRLNSNTRVGQFQSMLNLPRFSFYYPKTPSIYPLINNIPSSFFQMFGFPEEDYYLHPMDELFDPLPANEDFWSVMNNRLSVDNLEMSLSFRGKNIQCTISTTFYHQPQIELAGGYLFIVTQQWLSNLITNQMEGSAHDAFSSVIGHSPALKAAIQRGLLMSQVNGNVLLLGESGTGKEVFAHAIHQAGPRRDKPFVAINCGALPRDLIVSELFGYENGAFTGAKKQGHPGKFEMADGGTLFLDEIGELPLEQQAMLLRVVEQKKITRLGGTKEIPVDVRIICATNQDLRQMAQQRTFREDLYYRLSTFHINLPPLRDREDDCILLAEYYISKIAANLGRKDAIRLDEEAKELLCSLPWHGNVRELRNLMEYMVCLYPVSTITRKIVLESLSPESMPDQRPLLIAPSPVTPVSSVKHTEGLDEETIRLALAQNGGNRSEAAKELGIARRTLYNYLKKYDI